MFVADLVYDASVISGLVQLLKSLLSRQSLSTAPTPVAYVACTVRSEDTRDQFLYSLGTFSFYSETCIQISILFFIFNFVKVISKFFM